MLALVAIARTLSRQAGAAGAMAVVGTVTAVLVAAVFAVQMAVDGVALKGTVDTWAHASSAADTSTAFLVADGVRWIEKALSSFFHLLNGTTLLVLGLSVAFGGMAQRWLGWVGVVAGILFLAGGIIAPRTGFSPDSGRFLTSGAPAQRGLPDRDVDLAATGGASDDRLLGNGRSGDEPDPPQSSRIRQRVAVHEQEVGGPALPQDAGVRLLQERAAVARGRGRAPATVPGPPRPGTAPPRPAGWRAGPTAEVRSGGDEHTGRGQPVHALVGPFAAARLSVSGRQVRRTGARSWCGRRFARTRAPPAWRSLRRCWLPSPAQRRRPAGTRARWSPPAPRGDPRAGQHARVRGDAALRADAPASTTARTSPAVKGEVSGSGPSRYSFTRSAPSSSCRIAARTSPSPSLDLHAQARQEASPPWSPRRPPRARTGTPGRPPTGHAPRAPAPGCGRRRDRSRSATPRRGPTARPPDRSSRALCSAASSSRSGGSKPRSIQWAPPGRVRWLWLSTIPGTIVDPEASTIVHVGSRIRLVVRRPDPERCGRRPPAR